MNQFDTPIYVPPKNLGERWEHMDGGMRRHEYESSWIVVTLCVLDSDGLVQAWAQQVFHEDDFSETYPEIYGAIMEMMIQQIEYHLEQNDEEK